MTMPQCGSAAQVRASPNFGERAAPGVVDMLLLHYTGMADADDALSWLCDPASQVSCHYFVFEDGRIVQLVAEEDRAWHAGQSVWHGESDINSRSIGIEIANPGHEFGYRAFEEIQIQAVIALCADILQRRPVPPHRVLAHSDVAPDRKEDPGELFPWERLAKAGIGRWVAPAPIQVGMELLPGAMGPPINALQAMLTKLGYGCDRTGVYDLQTKQVVRAFQRHFRQERVDGIADRSTLETLRSLLEAGDEKPVA